MKMSQTNKDVFDVLDQFIVAVEETKEVLQSPKAPGRPELCCLCSRRKRLKRKLAELESIPELTPRLSASDGDLSRCGCKNKSEIDETDFLVQHETQEEKAKGLVFEMETLLNQLSTAASSLKVIYRRRSSEDMEV